MTDPGAEAEPPQDDVTYSWWDPMRSAWSTWSTWWTDMTTKEDFHAVLHREMSKVRLQEEAVQRSTDALRARLEASAREQVVCTRQVELCQRERLRSMRQIHAQIRGLEETMDALVRHLEKEDEAEGVHQGEDNLESGPEEHAVEVATCTLLRDLLVEQGEEDLTIVDPSTPLVEQAQQSWRRNYKAQRRARDEVQRAQCKLRNDHEALQEELRHEEKRASELETLRHHMEKAASSTVDADSR